MKNIIKNGFCALLVSATFFSCETVEEVVLPRNEKPVVNFTTSSATVAESGSTEITITTDTPISKDIIFKLFQIDGNAVSGTDYSFAEESALDFGAVGWRVVIPAGTSSGSVMISSPIKNYAADAVKSAVFQLESMESMRGVSGATDNITLDIVDSTDEQLTMKLEWDNGGADALCDADFDAYLDTFEAYMFTGNCPEFVDTFVDGNSLVSGILTDGTHNIVVDYWDGHGLPAGTPFPMKLSLGKLGKFLITIDLKGLYSTGDPDTNSGGNGEKVVGKIVVSGGLYSIFNSNDELVFQE